MNDINIDELEPISDHDLHLRYDEMLDECLDWVILGSLTYSPSQTLKAVDPIAYRCGFNDWLNAEMQDNRYADVDGIIFILENN